MNREQAIEQAALAVLARYDQDDGIIDVNTDFDIMEALREALALPHDTTEPVAYMHTVIDDDCEDGESDSALSFDQYSFPCEGVNGYKSVSVQPLYTHPINLDEREALLGALTFGYADGGLQTFEHRQAFRKKAEEAIQLCEGE